MIAFAGKYSKFEDFRNQMKNVKAVLGLGFHDLGVKVTEIKCMLKCVLLLSRPMCLDTIYNMMSEPM